MKRLALLLALAIPALPAFAAKLSCEALKTKIQDEIAAKGVKKFSLEIVPQGEAAAGKVVGSCDGGKKKIVYQRG
ncbi:MAG: DUF1161 domain-containing protein [Betaproteobacteria bacterium]|nr:DUF1161 domain-containing protein [Betaproteobacteria bacterium]